MTLAPLSSRDPGADEPRASDLSPAGPGMFAPLGLSLWCGMLAGLLEVVGLVARKRFWDTNRLLSMSRHFLWLIPLTDLLILLLAGVMGCLVLTLRPAGGRRTVWLALGTLTLLPVLLAAIPQVYGPAWLLVALGLSIRLVPILERHGAGFRRLVLTTSPILAGTMAALGVVPWMSEVLQRSRDQGRPIPTDAPNVLLVVMDTVAAEHLTLYGYSRQTSPAIDELARGGCRFDAAVSSTSWTLPSHASLFTGRWPHELSVGWRTPLDATFPTIAEVMRDRGYDTAGFIANTTYCADDSGLGRGYSVYRDYTFHDLSPFRMAVMVQKSLETLQAIGEAAGDALDLAWLRAGVTRIRERFEPERKEASMVNREFLDWLSQRPRPVRPYFAFLNYFDAHSPYQLSPRRIHRFGAKPGDEADYRLIQDWWSVDKGRLAPEQLAFVFNSYDDCVASVDEQIGRLFDELRRRKALERTWVILVADHGESFGEHRGVYLHGSSLYRTEVRVPLVVIPPRGIQIRPVVGETVSLRDIAATIADLAGHGDDSPFPGKSLAGTWRSATDPPPANRSAEPALAELVPNETLDPAGPDPSRRTWPMAALTEDGWSYIRREGGPREELYDLRSDPAEQRDLASSDASHPRLERIRAVLSRMTLGPLTPERFNP